MTANPTSKENTMPEETTDIEPGDRVTLFISEYPDMVSGTVLRVYLDAIGSLVADVELCSGDVWPQCVRFLMKDTAHPPYKERLLQRWRDADEALRAHPGDHPVCAFPGQRWGCPDWQRLSTVMDDIESRMLDAGMPSPSSEVYAGAGGAELYLADLA